MTYQWFAAGSPIAGATSSSFTPGVAQVGSTLTVTTTAHLAGYTDASRSSATTAAVAPGTLRVTGIPMISGDAQVGNSLAVDGATWVPTPDTTTYQWLADGAPIEGSNGTTLDLTPDLEGAVVSVAVTGAKTGYSPSTVASAATDPVLGGDSLDIGTPTITGDPIYGSTLVADPGTWGPGSVTLTYQWLREGSPVPGATAVDYLLGVDDLGSKLSVVVTGHQTGYATATAVSNEIGPVGRLTLTQTPEPSISGEPRLDAELTVEPGVWGPGEVALTYQWLRDGSPVPGATSVSYLLGPDDLGAAMSVRVTGERAGYESATTTSQATVPVMADQLETATPTVSGDAVYGSILTADPGAWGPDGVMLTYQWLRDGSPVEGAASLNYTTDTADIGHTMSVKVSGHLAGYLPASTTSAVTAAIVPRTTISATPVITGTVKMSQTLTATTPGWSAGTSFSYQWKRDGAAIAGATAATYKPGEADLSKKLSVTVTGAQTGWTTTTATSAATDSVASPRGDTLGRSARLNNGEALYSGNLKYKLVQQGDGNLVIYNRSTGKAVWASGTNGKGAAYVVMQSDGNLVEYTSAGKAVWATGTNGKGGQRLVMQSDGNLVIYTSANRAVWASNTAGR